MAKDINRIRRLIQLTGSSWLTKPNGSQAIRDLEKLCPVINSQACQRIIAVCRAQLERPKDFLTPSLRASCNNIFKAQMGLCLIAAGFPTHL